MPVLTDQKHAIFRMEFDTERAAFQGLLKANSSVQIVDTYETQLSDLLKTQNPSQVLSKAQVEEQIEAFLRGKPIKDVGTWVYYPWMNSVVHLLDEQQFAWLRTNRNKNKITAEEQFELSKKKIGLIGLSVGHSVATTLALERSFGELRVADYDHLDLSNLNRIRTGVHNIGKLKTSIARQEIAELDPYLQIEVYENGLNAENIDEFLTKDGGLDLLIDECDSLEIKLLCREKAKALSIPVIMETSDRGMLDIERYDLDQELPLFNGWTNGIGSKELKNLNEEEAFNLIMGIVDVKNCSNRMQASLQEIRKTISTWPQLGSDVVHGGATVARVARKILLGHEVKSGRYYALPKDGGLQAPSTTEAIKTKREA